MNSNYDKPTYKIRYTKNIYELLKKCYFKDKNKDMRFLIFITDNQLIIGLSDDDLYFGHLDISRKIQKEIFPKRHYFDNNKYEYNKALRIYGYGCMSAFGDLPEKVSIIQYNCLIELMEEIKRFANDFNCFDILKYYNSIINLAENMTTKETSIEEDEVIIGIKLNNNLNNEKILLK